MSGNRLRGSMPLAQFDVKVPGREEESGQEGKFIFGP